MAEDKWKRAVWNTANRRIVSPFQYFLQLAMEIGAEHPEDSRREGGGAV
jgi:hypothetical protein